MNKEQIREKLLVEKNAKLIDILDLNNKHYAKTLIMSKGTDFNFEYKYYEILHETIKEINDIELEEIKQFFETNLGNIVY